MKRDGQQTLGDLIAPADRTMPPRAQVVGHGFMAAASIAFLIAGWQTAKREAALLIRMQTAERSRKAAEETRRREDGRETVAIMTPEGAICAGKAGTMRHPAGALDDCDNCLKFRAGAAAFDGLDIGTTGD